MNELIEFVEAKQTMSSLEIAKLTGKPHNDVLKAIRTMEPAWVKVNGGNFSRVEYRDAKGEMRPAFELTKIECLYVATKFNDEARAKLVIRWEELEKKELKRKMKEEMEKKSPTNMISIPDFTDPAEAAIAWAKEYREKKVLAIENHTLEIENKRLECDNIELAAENQELRNDKNYLDIIMRSRKMMTISQIAQDYGMSGKAMNQKLSEMGIQYKCNDQWILYARYKDCGYVSSRSIEITRSNGMPDVVLHTEWTQAGRKFLY